MSKTLVIIPTYNEIDNLESIVGRVRVNATDVDILIVDDNSPDGTGRLADRLADESQVSVLHRLAKNGLGAAYLDGFGWGIERGYDVLVEMDADGSHRPEELHRLLTPLTDGADLVIGSRWVPGGSVVNWPRRREWLSRGGNVYVRIMLGIEVRDATAGYRAYRRETLLRLDLAAVQSEGYCFQVDLTRRAAYANLTIIEVPIRFVERLRGSSKMSGHIVREALWRVTYWGVAWHLMRLRFWRR